MWTIAEWFSIFIVSIKDKAVKGFTKDEAASFGVVPSSITKQLIAGTQIYWEYIDPPASPTVLPISSLTFLPASTTIPAPSFPTAKDLSNRGFIVAIRPGWIFIEATKPSPDSEMSILERSPANVRSRPISEGLIGAAWTSINTSSSAGIGLSTLTIDISILPSLVTIDLICLEYEVVMTLSLSLF